MFHNFYKPKRWGDSDNIEPQIFHNFLSEQNLKEVWDSVNANKNLETGKDFYAPYIYEKESRQQIELNISKDLLNYIENFASDFVGEPVVMTHNSYLSYKKSHSKNGFPALPPHFDSDNYFTKLTMDYQLRSNISFPIVIDVNKELKSFDLKDNEMLLFWGAGTIHWREPVLFNDEDHCEVWTMHFANKKDYEDLSVKARDEKERRERLNFWINNNEYLKYVKIYSKKMNDIIKLYKNQEVI